MRRPIILVYILTLFSSCDPGYAVYLMNDSSKNREIRVLENEAYKLSYVDSVLVSNTLSTDFSSGKTEMQAVKKDSLSNSYIFPLDKGKTALLRSGIGRPEPNLNSLPQKIIIDSEDTIIIKNDNRVKVKRQFMSTSVVITIQ